MMGDYSAKSKPRISSKFAEQRPSKVIHCSTKDGLTERLDGDGECQYCKFQCQVILAWLALPAGYRYS